MLKKAVETMTKGIVVSDSMIYSSKVTEGRFAEEVDLDIYLKSSAEERFLLYVKVYHGRRPYYRPWVEFFGINRAVDTYLDSALEGALLRLFSRYIEPGGKIYVEYHHDRETSIALERRFPPPVTRLGYKLFNLGFTWFKDWYFPEGFMEGGLKLQGEKPLNDDAKRRHLMGIRSQVQDFLERVNAWDEQEWYVIRAMERATALLALDTIAIQHLSGDEGCID